VAMVETLWTCGVMHCENSWFRRDTVDDGNHRNRLQAYLLVELSASGYGFAISRIPLRSVSIRHILHPACHHERQDTEHRCKAVDSRTSPLA
jgi:hypothetical protein